jgi:large subunit ribosomal protein L4
LALKSALTSKVRDGEFIVVDALTFAEPKTQEMVKVLQNLKRGKSPAGYRRGGAQRHQIRPEYPGVKTLPANQLNVYDILYYHNLLVTQDALTRVEEVFA